MFSADHLAVAVNALVALTGMVLAWTLAHPWILLSLVGLANLVGSLNTRVCPMARVFGRLGMTRDGLFR